MPSTTPPTRGIVPNHATVIHIGPPKTGTTTIQSAAKARLDELMDNGVHYVDGPRRKGVAAFMGRGFGWRTDEEGSRAGGRVPMRYWRALKDEIDQEQERIVWLSQEQIAHSTLEDARRWYAELGPDLHVVMTLRPFSQMVPSIWQQTLKGVASREPFEQWLRRALEPGNETHDKLMITYDQAELVNRWASVVGLENVTVVVLDSADHSFLGKAFEQLFGLPDGLLAEVDSPQRAVNRSMSAAEIELIRQLNIRARKAGLDWHDHDRLVTRGAVSRLLQERTPARDEARLALPAWAEARMREEEEKFVAAISGSGVRVIGDVQNLIAKVSSKERIESDHRDVTSVPLDAAVEALLGMLGVATGHDYMFKQNRAAVMGKLKADARHDLRGVRKLGHTGWLKVVQSKARGAWRAVRARF